MKIRNFIFFIIVIILSIFTFHNFDVAADEAYIYLYGFGDDYDDDDYLTLYNNRTCYIALINIPLSERDNIQINFSDDSVAEIYELSYYDTNPVITAEIKAKKIGKTDIIASLNYNGNIYTSKITTTVRESNYRISLRLHDDYNDKVNTFRVNEPFKLDAFLIQGMAWLRGDVSSSGIWSSSNENVASVSTEGLVTGINNGETTITFSYLTNEGVTIKDTFDMFIIENGMIADWNGDGDLNLVDLVNYRLWLAEDPEVRNEYIKFTNEQKNILDLNKSGDIDIGDLIMVREMLVSGKIPCERIASE